MKVINQDLLKISHGVIGHQVNCQGVMGGGLALAIRKKYPVVYNKYREYCQYWQEIKGKNQDISRPLGIVHTVEVNPELIVLNIFGQDGYGAGKQTDYVALDEAAQYLVKTYTRFDLKVYLPYGMGCGLGGGDWQTVQAIFQDVDGYWCKKN